jgi:hypothetical protein
LINQTPTRNEQNPMLKKGGIDESNPYKKRVGLMNQTPTRNEQNPMLKKGGLDESSP